MTTKNETYLKKAILTTTDLGTGATLNPEQADEFLRLAIAPQVMLPEVRTVRSSATKWQEAKIDFGSRILRPGVEGERLTYEERAKPTTGYVEISTVLVKGEVPISDEVMEENVEREGFADTIVQMVAEGSGRDLEELFIRGDTGSPDGYLAQLNGWLKQAEVGAGAHVYDAAADGQDYQSIFKKLLLALPDQYKRDIENMRFYVPVRLEEIYRDQLSARGTPLGDQTLQGKTPLTYQGIKIRGVPLFPIAPGASDTSKVLLTHRLNLYAGYRRQIRLETYRDPREGATSFIVTARADAKIAVIPATALAYNVNVEP